MNLRINLISRSNGVGLDQDVNLIYNILTRAGFEVTISHARSAPLWSYFSQPRTQYDANIFLERVFPRWFSSAKKNFLIPNQERFPRRHLKYLNNIDIVLCKTKHAFSIFSEYSRCQYIGFTSEDRALPHVEMDYNSYLHLAGRSTLKGTETILDLWSKHPDWPKLTLIQCKENAPTAIPENVRLISRYLKKDDLLKELNSHGVHLCLSKSEGWGHYIVEAMSCEAIIISTDAPPMNEIVNRSLGVTVPYVRQENRHLGINFYADSKALKLELNRLFKLKEEDKIKYGKNARKWYEQNHKTFVSTFPDIIQELLNKNATF